MALKTYKAVFY